MPRMEVELEVDWDEAAQVAYEAFVARNHLAGEWVNLRDITKDVWRNVAKAVFGTVRTAK